MKFDTLAVQGGEFKDERIGNVVTPIFQNSTFTNPNYDPDAYLDPTTGKPFLYSRWSNPTVASLEEKYRLLEGSEKALAFSSGMGAISSTVIGLAQRGKKIAALRELYGQTYSFLLKDLARAGFTVDFYSLDELNTQDINFDSYSLLFLESIVNPTLGVADIEKIGKDCMDAGISMIVDATFATPFNQKPFEFGASAVVHSATKYLGGHSDIILGVGGFSKTVYPDVASVRKSYGASADPFQSYLALRGIKTLGLRMVRHNESAHRIAKFLAEHPRVSNVYYPLTSEKYSGIARRVLRGGGGMVSFDVKGNTADARRFLTKLSIVHPAASLGGVESLATLPVDTSHSSMSREERQTVGINDSMVRLSVGIEDVDDLIEDLDQALRAL